MVLFLVCIAYMLISARLWFPMNGFIVSRLVTDAAARPGRVKGNFALVSALQFLIAAMLVLVLWLLIGGSRGSVLLVLICAPYTIVFTLLALGALFTVLMMLFKEPTVVVVAGHPRFAMTRKIGRG